MELFLTAIICITVLISGYWIRDVIKSGKKGNLKANLKTGEIEMSGGDNNAPKEQASSTAPAPNPTPTLTSIPEATQIKMVERAYANPIKITELEGKSSADIGAYYHSQDYEMSRNITSLAIYKEYSKLISQAILKIQTRIITFIGKNNITKKDAKEYRIYTKEKIDEIIQIIDETLHQSDISCVSSLTVEKLTNYYFLTLKDLIGHTYRDIYDNHLSTQEDRQKELQSILEQKAGVKAMIVSITESHVKTTVRDCELVLESMEYLQSFLLGIFHDNIKYNGGVKL